MISGRLFIVTTVGVLPLCAQEPQEESPRVELEYVSSDVFRSGTGIVKLWRGLHLDGEYFGAPAYDVGITGASWKFRWKGLSVSPGFGVDFGSHVLKGPVVTFRWTLDTHRWFSQGFFAQSLQEYIVDEEGKEPFGVRGSVLDNNHFSIRLGPIEAGPLWERIKYRDENEWKGGGRLAMRFGRRLKLIFQTVAPDVEFRGGIAFEQ
jgi:hypothetical protein